MLLPMFFEEPSASIFRAQGSMFLWKCLYLTTKLHGVTAQKAVILTFAAARISDLILDVCLCWQTGAAASWSGVYVNV